MFKKIFQRQSKMEVLKKAELFRKLVTEIDISKYKQKEFEKKLAIIQQAKKKNIIKNMKKEQILMMVHHFSKMAQN